jgi:RNA polymerase sigma-70 factor (ECF subfamily)
MASDKRSCDNIDQRIQDGQTDESLMEAVANCLAEEVKRFAATRCGGGRGDVEDIAQDAMLAAQRYLGGFRGEASLRTWLYKLVLSACSRQRRGRKNDPGLHRPLDEAASAADPADPELALLVSERMQVLEQALADLRPADREILAAVEWEGQTLEQVAQQTGLTVSAVKSRLFRIRRQLREQVTARFAAEAPGD